MLKCLTAPRIAKTSQELPPQNKWAASFQPEDAGTKLNFLYDDLDFGGGEAELEAELEADPVVSEIHWYPKTHGILDWEVLRAESILLGNL